MAKRSAGLGSLPGGVQNFLFGFREVLFHISGAGELRDSHAELLGTRCRHRYHFARCAARLRYYESIMLQRLGGALLALALVDGLDHRAGDVGRALAAHRPVVGHQRLDAERRITHTNHALERIGNISLTSNRVTGFLYAANGIQATIAAFQFSGPGARAGSV